MMYELIFYGIIVFLLLYLALLLGGGIYGNSLGCGGGRGKK